LHEFLSRVYKEEVRYEISVDCVVETLCPALQKYTFRLYGYDGKNVIVYEEARIFRTYVDKDELQKWLEEKKSLVEKLGARPGRLE